MQTIAGIGPTTAAAVVATVGEPREFRDGVARIIWALLARGEDFDVQRLPPKIAAVAA